MSEEKPLVTIGLITYNRAFTLPRAVDSLLGQTYKNIDLLISDDASKDNTKEVCREYAKSDSRVRYMRQEKNLGVQGNIYFAVKAARGKYLMRATDDDWWKAEYIEKMVEVLEKNPNHAIAQSSYQRVYDDGKIEYEWILSGNKNLTNQSYQEVYKQVFMKHRGIEHYLNGLSRTDFLKRIMSRPPSVLKGWDSILVSEMAMATHFYSVQEMLRYSNNKLGREGKIIQGLMDYHDHDVPFKPKYKFVSTTYWNLFYRSLIQVLTSKEIPFFLRISVFIPWTQALWIKRRKVFGFFYGRFFKFAKASD